jgi:hypothetical protein
MADYQAYRPFSDLEVRMVTSFLKTLTGEYRGRMLE